MIRLTTLNKAFSTFFKVLLSQENPKEVENVQNWGFDSKPPKGERGLLLTTDNNKTSAIVGYILRSEETEIGETRMYATDSSGNVLGDVKLNNDSEFVILGGSDYAVQHTPLKTGLNNQDTAINTELTKLSVTISAMVSAFYSLGVTIPAYTKGNISTDIDNSKVEKVRL